MCMANEQLIGGCWCWNRTVAADSNAHFTSCYAVEGDGGGYERVDSDEVIGRKYRWVSLPILFLRICVDAVQASPSSLPP